MRAQSSSALRGFDPRPSSEAGAPTAPVRWYPTHGYQHEQPPRLRAPSPPRVRGPSSMPRLPTGSPPGAGPQAALAPPGSPRGRARAPPKPAHHLVHGALVAMGGLYHAFENGIQRLSSVLGITVGEQLQRSLEVGEEDRDLLALAFERRLGGQDPLGEVLRGVGLGRGEARGRGLAGGVGALRAELGARRQRGAAPRAREERRAAGCGRLRVPRCACGWDEGRMP